MRLTELQKEALIKAVEGLQASRFFEAEETVAFSTQIDDANYQLLVSLTRDQDDFVEENNDKST
jgi:hypothetical protein